MSRDEFLGLFPSQVKSDIYSQGNEVLVAMDDAPVIAMDETDAPVIAMDLDAQIPASESVLDENTKMDIK